MALPLEWEHARSNAQKTYAFIHHLLNILNHSRLLKSGTNIALISASLTINCWRVPMHRLIMTTMTLCVLILASALAWAAMEAPADLKLGPPEGMKATKPLVLFSHGAHNSAKVECATCHHTWDGSSDIRSCSASGCHDQPGKKGKTSFYSAFHSKKSKTSCLGCHKINKKAGKSVPVACKSCHPK